MLNASRGDLEKMWLLVISILLMTKDLDIPRDCGSWHLTFAIQEFGKYIKKLFLFWVIKN
ncbi:hypothetical protein CXU10_07155 [Akkermansia muciniphila]|nr:hypothetical protein CXU10_07155 [Akkermansia muciniphila]